MGVDDAQTSRGPRHDAAASSKPERAVGEAAPGAAPSVVAARSDISSDRSDPSSLREDVERGRVALYGQPILELATNEVRQFELLLQIPSRSDELLTPADCVVEATQRRGSPAFEIWAICEAIAMIAQYERADERLSLQVRISGASINAEAAALVEDALSRASIDPASLILEAGATDRSVGPQPALSFAQRMRHRGCRFVLSDFPSLGSFYNVGTLPVDSLKIDDDFVRGVAANLPDQLVVRTIVDIARGLGKPTIAGFVDDAATAQRLQRYGVDYVGGRHAGLPRAFTDSRRLVARGAALGRRSPPPARPFEQFAK